MVNGYLCYDDLNWHPKAVLHCSVSTILRNVHWIRVVVLLKHFVQPGSPLPVLYLAGVTGLTPRKFLGIFSVDAPQRNKVYPVPLKIPFPDKLCCAITPRLVNLLWLMISYVTMNWIDILRPSCTAVGPRSSENCTKLEWSSYWSISCSQGHPSQFCILLVSQN